MKEAIAIILIIGAIVVFFIVRHKFKAPLLSDFTGFTGGVKTGKSTTSIAFAIQAYKRRLRRVKVRNFVGRLFAREQQEIPLFYSNIPINIKQGYVPFTKELLLRQERFRYGSVVYINEASLVADAQCWGVDEIDEKMSEFCKLIGHETKGGCLYWDTQSISDLHFAFKKCTSQYVYIYKIHKPPIIPFIWVQYNMLYYSYDGNMVNINDGDIRDDIKTTFIWKSVWKKFDCYCYSALTDDKKVNAKTKNPTTLKQKEIISIKEWYKQLKKENKKR